MNKEQRQQKLIQLIQQLKHVTAAELAKQLGVSKRTILRDIQALESKGVHLQTHMGQKGGYRMQMEMNQNALTFSDDEMQALYLVLNESLSLSTLPYHKEIATIVEKLLKHPNVTLRQNIQHIDQYIRITPNTQTVLPRLFSAILVYCHERKVMALEYHQMTSQHPFVENVVFIGLLCEAGNWQAVVYHIGGGYTKVVDIAEINDISYSFYKSIQTQDITLDNYQLYLKEV